MRLPALLLVLLTLAGVTAGAAQATPYRLTVPAEGTERGTVLLIHGGAWAAVGQQYADDLEPVAERFASYGWRAQSIDYRQGHKGLRDVVRAYDDAHARDPDQPICAYGESAGGTWALMLAARRPALTCVLDAAGPTDFAALPLTGKAFNTRLAAAYWFSVDPARWVPIDHVAEMKADITLMYETDDPQVPFDQGTLFHAAAPDSRFLALQPGSVTWMHGAVSSASAQAAESAEQAALDRAADH